MTASRSTLGDSVIVDIRAHTRHPGAPRAWQLRHPGHVPSRRQPLVTILACPGTPARLRLRLLARLAAALERNRTLTEENQRLRRQLELTPRRTSYIPEPTGARACRANPAVSHLTLPLYQPNLYFQILTVSGRRVRMILKSEREKFRLGEGNGLVGSVPG